MRDLEEIAAARAPVEDGVEHNRTRDALAALEMTSRDNDWRGLREIGREDARGRCIGVGGQHRQIESADRGFDAAVQRCRAEAVRRRDAAGRGSNGEIAHSRRGLSHGAQSAARRSVARERGDASPRTACSFGTACRIGSPFRFFPVARCAARLRIPSE